MNETIRYFSECYFGYEMTLGKDELNLRSQEDLWPKLYIEKSGPNKFTLFITFPNWYNPVNKKDYKNANSFIYTKATIAFDPKGYDLSDIVSRCERKEDKDMLYVNVDLESEQIVNKGRFEHSLMNYSGVGAIVLSNGRKESVVYFAINYAPKKKIYYYIESNKITFKTKNDVGKLTINVLKDSEKVPCLKNVVCEDSDEHIIDLSSGSATIKKKDDNLKYYVDFGGTPEEIELNRKMYVLICEQNKSTKTNKSNQRIINSKIYCPYCNEEFKHFEGKHTNGVFCDGVEVNNFNILNKYGKPISDFICCKTIRTNKARIFRMLPTNIEKKRNYRIAILGKARSGKTTFISRLFNVQDVNGKISMQTGIHPGFNYYNITHYASKALSKHGSISDSDNNYIINEIDYFANPERKEVNDFFSKYVISFKNKKFIAATKEGENANTLKYPFILDVNDKAYAYIYDIAGEDVEKGSDTLNKISIGDNVGLVIVIDIDIANTKDVNELILKTIQSTYKDKEDTCPIAIVLSKFDRFEKDFSSNCACLSANYEELLTKNLNGSSLIHHIDTASDEIESYLIHNEIDIRKDYLSKFNIKFFGVSAVTYPDAIYHEDNSNKELEKNGLNFMCGSKRIELPIIWLMHELGEI